MDNKRIALFISYLFEPMVVIYALALIGGKYAGLQGILWVYYVLYLSFLGSVVAVFRLCITSKDHTNWDISDRKKRIRPLFILTFTLATQYLIVGVFQNSFLSSLFFWFTIWSIGFFLMTLRVKISGHLSILTYASLLFISWYGIKFYPLLFLIPLLSWSRIALKRHTMKEVLFGIVFSACIVLLSSIIG